ncbi:hypothetical protein [Extibacter muris]|uniref:Uncharacterized protein n=2 Tax=Extibacter muris TaxID=1796622 RepID=A0A4R4F9S9_9FIRM|nr:hypothetical protein [Extibacter muris]MCU0081536.1 hypothetical protein [Extibacter muris]TDA20078.1 hypothetical protein E1963_19060 [Extibacter muris]
MGEDFIPQMENGYPPNLKNQKLQILESKMNIPQNKIWGHRLKGSELECLEIFVKPVKYIVPAIYGWNSEKGKFAKQMGQ